MQKVTFLTWRELGKGRRELRAAEPPAVGPGAPNCISSPCPLPPPCIRPSAAHGNLANPALRLLPSFQSPPERIHGRDDGRVCPGPLQKALVPPTASCTPHSGRIPLSGCPQRRDHFRL